MPKPGAAPAPAMNWGFHASSTAQAAIAKLKAEAKQTTCAEPVESFKGEVVEQVLSLLGKLRPEAQVYAAININRTTSGDIGVNISIAPAV